MPLKLEWGAHGLESLVPESDVVIIVDVLSFSTAVDIAVSNGAVIFPYGGRDDSLAAYAQTHGARTAEKDRAGGLSLSPKSLLSISAGYRLVLPSPNGSALCRASDGAVTLTACLRNAVAVAQAASRLGRKIAVIPAGEQWPDGSMRPAIEDLLGAGAVLARLTGTLSPEAQAAVAAFDSLRDSLPEALRECPSGQELIARGFAEDVEIPAQLDVSSIAPILRDGAFIDYNEPR